MFHQKDENLMLLRQDKDRVFVIINWNKYTNKCLNILNTEQFQKLDRDPNKPINNEDSKSC